MPSKQDELRWHDEAYREFRDLVDGIDEPRFEEKWLDGRWGVREIVWHLAGWHREFATGLERMARGERPAPEGVDWSDVQRWNDSFAGGGAGQGQGASAARIRRAGAALPAPGGAVSRRTLRPRQDGKQNGRGGRNRPLSDPRRHD